MSNAYYEALPDGYSGLGDARWDKGPAGRDALVKKYAWAIPTDDALDAILATANELVEIGAGRGYWAHLLSERGATVHAYDNGSWTMHSDVHPWHPVEHGGPEMVELHPDAAAFISWPPYDDPMAFDVARRLRPGQKLIYIGEDDGGCNGDDEFWGMIRDDFIKVRGVALPQWWGLHDWLTIYERKEA